MLAKIVTPLKTLLIQCWQQFTRLLQRIRRRRGGLPSLIALVVVLLVSLIIATRPQLKPVAVNEKVWVVEAIRAHHRSIQPALTLYGLVFAGRQSDLRAQVSGNVVAVGDRYKEGGLVDVGELLLQIDPFEYENTLVEKQALLDEARSRLELLDRDHVRARELFRNKDASKQFLDTAELTLEQQKSIVVQREVGVNRARRDLQQTKLLAPYNGVIDEVSAELGMRLSTNDKVALVIDTQRLEARFSLSNAQYGRILAQDGTIIGRSVDVIWRVGSNRLHYEGRVERQGAQISSSTGGVDMYAELNVTGAQLPLRPGAFVQITIADRRYHDVISVPEQALYDQDTVYVVKEQRLAARKVKVVGAEGSRLLIQSDGDTPIVDSDVLMVSQLREGGEGIKVSVQLRSSPETHSGSVVVDKVESEGMLSDSEKRPLATAQSILKSTPQASSDSNTLNNNTSNNNASKNNVSKNNASISRRQNNKPEEVMAVSIEAP